eukprot:CAMPEP_0119315930 /NCGR_PEP_ID=MMETSP1333-20130426/37780_1 /TAXON_ID=418940 /ORGANISM="Scyphosphaera apsteinii, Strain RCC1455" /LENGTH=30 /DNA_ID= /DNA_START= /DNA_END= /DNA_ORIENTATION=
MPTTSRVGSAVEAVAEALICSQDSTETAEA